jgi:Domain of unknown function (DUF4258)
MTFVFSKHVADREIQRRITEQDINDVMDNPKGLRRKAYNEVLYFGYTRKHIGLTVVYNPTNNKIVTAFWGN